ncbi:dihydrolipoyl dehydrogenase [Alienimonas californiensis]|uniref:Dihydrolipoyl dehydrogenase n=1 Tax=Alienimonas californiensis TaxID=2527989 RepID=A0A517P969_9PLAN|nr:dihydrolipoyl dehydrogenase [Alienimonas californiensis]QDT15919.1 Dihydrolipoyl dehydrogenase [Alienimonas californiensis]
MARDFVLPEVSEGVTEADVSEVLVAEGDTVEENQVVVEVETEKAVAPVEIPFAGKVTKVHVAPGDTVKIGAPLMTVEPSGVSKGDGGGDATPDAAAAPQKAEQPTAANTPAEAAAPGDGDKARTGDYDTAADPFDDVRPEGAPTPKNELPEGAYDVVVLGGGPGGYPAAFEAADRGMKVALIDENPKFGGVCLRVGCIPSKTLLHVAKLLHEAEEAEQWGIHFEKPTIDLAKLRDFKSGVVNKLTGGVSQLGKGRGVEMIEGRGTLTGSNSLTVKGPDGKERELHFARCIVAVGSQPAVPKIFDIGDDRVMNSTGALELKDVPEKLLVVGGGYIGLEMGSVYAALGSKVTVVEMTDGLLPGADRDLVKPLQTRIEQAFDRVLLNTKVESLEATDGGIKATLSGEQIEGGSRTESFDRVLIAIGRRPNGKTCGVETTKAEVDDRGFVVVNRRMETADPNILAIGDVAGEPMLAHKATREAKIAVETIAGEDAVFDNRGVPAVVFTDPELAWVGLTESEAQRDGVKVTVARFPWGASGRAQTIDRTDGLTKLICDPESGRILGVGIVGANAGELIAEGTLAVEMGAVAADLAETIHAHPTLSETLMEGGEAVFGQATHYFKKKR